MKSKAWMSALTVFLQDSTERIEDTIHKKIRSCHMGREKATSMFEEVFRDFEGIRIVIGGTKSLKRNLKI